MNRFELVNLYFIQRGWRFAMFDALPRHAPEASQEPEVPPAAWYNATRGSEHVKGYVYRVPPTMVPLLDADTQVYGVLPMLHTGLVMGTLARTLPGLPEYTGRIHPVLGLFTQQQSVEAQNETNELLDAMAKAEATQRLKQLAEQGGIDLDALGALYDSRYPQLADKGT